MKRILFAAAALSAVFVAAPAEAQQRYPDYTRYCVDSSFDDVGPILICSWRTLAECQASRASQSERCFLNPAFANSAPRRDTNRR